MGMDKRLFLLISIFVLAILLVGVAYAKNDKDKPMKDTSIKWDNKGDFIKIAEQKYGKYEIFDSIFLGVGKGKKLMDIELKENTETCTQNCYAIKDIILYENGSLVDDIVFKTLQQDGSWVEQSIRWYKFYIKQPVEEIVVNDYDISCIINPQTQIKKCEFVVIGNHTELTPEWIPYQFGDLLPAGTYTLKLIGEKRPTRIVDWIIQSQGIWTTDWATWGNISLGDTAEVRLISPADNSIAYNKYINFSGYANVTGGAELVNISLWNNATGTWHRNETRYIKTYENWSVDNAYFSGGSAKWDVDFTTDDGLQYWILISESYLNIHVVSDNDGEHEYATYLVTANGTEGNFDSDRSFADIDIFSFSYSRTALNHNYFLVRIGDAPVYNFYAEMVGTIVTRTDIGRIQVRKYNSSYLGSRWYNRTSAVWSAWTVVPSGTGTDLNFRCMANNGNGGGSSMNCNVGDVRFGNYTGIYDIPQLFNRTINPLLNNTKWNMQGCDTDNVCGFAPSNYTLIRDTTPPASTITSPAEKYNFGKVGQLLYLNWSVSDLGGVNSCWYEYNNVNTTVNCTANTTTFAIVSPTVKSLKFWANDTLGNINYAETNWSYYIFENSQTYNSKALETSSQTFVINLTLDNTSIQSTYFWYNNTQYSTSLALDGNQAVLSRTITIPEVSVTTNFSFFWEVNLNSPQVNTTLQNQTVVAFTIDNCSVNSILVVNNTLVDEETQNKITGNSTIEIEVTLKNLAGFEMGKLSKIYYNTSYAPVCINSLLNSTLYVSIVTSYIANNYVQEFWYLDNGILNETDWNLDNFTTKNVTLRALKLDDSETFLFKYYNANFLITEGAIIRVLRNYIGEGVFKEAERCKLDANGECHLHLVGEDVIYSFQVIIDGTEDFLSGKFNAKCVNTPCSITLQKGATTNDWDIQHDNLAEGTYTLSTNKTDRTVTLVFNLAQTGEMQLDVFTYTNDPNTQDTLVATDTVIAKSGTASVLIPLSYGNITYYAVVRHNDAFVTTQWVDLNEDGYKYFGALGLFLGALIVLSLGLIAISSGGWTIVFIILGLIVASVTKLVNMDYYLLMFVVCAGGLIIWRLASRRSL